MQRIRLSRIATGSAASAVAVALTSGVASAEPVLPTESVPVSEPADTATPTPPAAPIPPASPPPTSSPPATTPSRHAHVAAAVVETPTHHADARPHAQPTPALAAAGEPDDGPRSLDPDNRLTTANLAKQIEAADQIWAQIMASNSGISIALKELQSLATQSNALLESLTEARAAEATATASAAQAKGELGVLQGRLDRARVIVREWAFQAYAEPESTDR